jgi:mRNA interferase RelE/StbE
MYSILLDKKAARQLDDLPSEDFERVSGEIDKLKEGPRPRGVRKIKGDIYRIRSGRYRIIYTVLDDGKIVLVHEVKIRREDTYKPYR